MSMIDCGQFFGKLCRGAVVVCFTAVCLAAASLTADGQKSSESRPAAASATPPTPTKPAAQDGAPELTDKASEAIDKGLKYLLRKQRKDGSWGSVGVTSLSLMAFMSQAEFPGYGPNGVALNRAKDWLLKEAKKSSNGYLGGSMYEHGLATLALTELWGMTGDRDKDDAVIQKAIEAAIDVILRAQNAGGGWRYEPTPDCGQDTSVTVMVFIGLASARQAGFEVPNETIAKVVKYLDSAVSKNNGGFNYIPTGRGGSKQNESIACTGGGAYAAQLAGKRGSEAVLGALRFLKERSPAIIDNNFGHYYYGHYYAIQAMVQAGDDYYAEWYPLIRNALIRRQGADGAWDTGKGSKDAKYTTPMAIIILATPNRYIPIYQR
jgi:hypothetical protein